MQSYEPVNDLVYRHEILCAKLELRDYYFKNIVSDIYENTGQLLSLVRVQLATIEKHNTEDIRSHIEKSGQLVGEVICNLRDMSRSLNPESEILSESGLTSAIKRELHIAPQDKAQKKLKVRGIPFRLEPESGIIFFCVILEITFLVTRSFGEDSLRLEIVYTTSRIKVSIDYTGQPIDLNIQKGIHDEFPAITKLDMQQRIKLIGGEIAIKSKTNKVRINISMPYNRYKAA